MRLDVPGQRVLDYLLSSRFNFLLQWFGSISFAAPPSAISQPTKRTKKLKRRS
jgi:hypothetical protein